MLVTWWHIHLLVTLLSYKTEAHITYPVCYWRRLKIDEKIKSRGDLISPFSFFMSQRSQEPRCLSGAGWGHTVPALRQAAFPVLCQVIELCRLLLVAGQPYQCSLVAHVREIFLKLFLGDNWIMAQKMYIVCVLCGSRRLGWAFGAEGRPTLWPGKAELAPFQGVKYKDAGLGAILIVQVCSLLFIQCNLFDMLPDIQYLAVLN